MRITIYTRKGAQRSYANVNSYDIHNVGPGILTFRHDDNYIEYYRLGSIDRWTIETEGEDEQN